MTEGIEEKIEKLLRVADGSANENESAVALQMAQKLADAYNLDIGTIGKSGARKDEQVSKGLYKYQRTLYSELAALNHCKVWITKGLTYGSKYQTRLLGSKVNVAVTKNLCDYLEEVANRMVRENYEPRAFFSRDAHLYREGMIDRMVERIKTRRAEEEKERQREKREQQARQTHPGAATENAIVLISDVSQAEEAANYDYLHGEGAWDRLIAARREREANMDRRLAEYKAWELANPEKVARQNAERQKMLEQERKRIDRLERASEKRRQERIDRFGYDPKEYRTTFHKTDSAAYWAGQTDGASVSIDDQIDHEVRKGIK